MRFIDPLQDVWQASSEEQSPAGATAYQLLCLEQWQAGRNSVPAGAQVGVLVPNDVDIETLRDDLPRLALIALDFPKWTDGRAYSQARLLRTRLRFTGELRATGEVLVDMVPLLHRTGFDAAVLRSGQSLAAAQRALGFFEAHYQGDIHQPLPVFAPLRSASQREAAA